MMDCNHLWRCCRNCPSKERRVETRFREVVIASKTLGSIPLTLEPDSVLGPPSVSPWGRFGCTRQLPTSLRWRSAGFYSSMEVGKADPRNSHPASVSRSAAASTCGVVKSRALRSLHCRICRSIAPASVVRSCVDTQ